MTVRAFILTIIAILPAIGAAGSDRAKKAAEIQTFTGEIMDSICAGYKSHDYMMQQMKSMGRDKDTCIKSCITQLGAKYVLFDRSHSMVYRIENPEKVESLAGHNVRISGALRKKDRISVNDAIATD